MFNNLLKQICHKRFLISGQRYCHSQDVRVRFAPSPTGYLHLGGLRTALYNYLFAKSKEGTFILRIEDTDQTRLKEEATEQIVKDLNWAGIKPDEGPLQGGDYGPYVQSERIDLYRNEVKQLFESGYAYHCFCTEKRLDLLRKEAVRARQIPKYDNRCRSLTPIKIAEKLANGESCCIRFKLDDDLQSFDDVVYGTIKQNLTQNEGDPVIIKSDGFPTYHFANVVDDHFMKITHVLRGVEWQSSTIKHLLIYRAFGWTPPKYAHLPLIMNADGTKLSKRQGDIQIDHYRKTGVQPRALINYIRLAGGGFEKEIAAKPKIASMDELVETFRLDRINTNSCRLNPELLPEYNRLEFIEMMNDEKKCEILIGDVREMIKSSFPDHSENLDVSSLHIQNVLKWAVTHITSLNQLVEGKFAFLWVLPSSKNKISLNFDTLNSLIDELKNEDFHEKENLNKCLRKFAETNKIKYNIFMKDLRTILSNLKEGPAVADMMNILGKESTIQRIKLNVK